MVTLDAETSSLSIYNFTLLPSSFLPCSFVLAPVFILVYYIPVRPFCCFSFTLPVLRETQRTQCSELSLFHHESARTEPPDDTWVQLCTRNEQKPQRALLLPSLLCEASVTLLLVQTFRLVMYRTHKAHLRRMGEVRQASRGRNREPWAATLARPLVGPLESGRSALREARGARFCAERPGGHVGARGQSACAGSCVWGEPRREPW